MKGKELMCCKNCCTPIYVVNPDLSQNIAKIIDEKLSGNTNSQSEVNKKMQATLGKFLENLLSKEWETYDSLESLKVDVVIKKAGFGFVNFQENFGTRFDGLKN